MRARPDPAERDPSLNRPAKEEGPHELVVKFKEGPGRAIEEIDGKLVAHRIDLTAFQRTLESLGRDSGAAAFARQSFPRFSRKLKSLGEDYVSVPILRGRARTTDLIRRHGGTRRRLDLFIRVSIQGRDVDLARWRGALASDPEVAYVLAAGRPSPPQIPSTTPSLEAEQSYLEAAPAGVDARYAWRVPGGSGLVAEPGGTASERVRIAVIDLGYNSTHEDLPQSVTIINAGGPPWPPDLLNEDHGTAALGILGAMKNGFGVTGLCHDADLRFGSYYVDPQLVGSAQGGLSGIIDTALADHLGPGDVMVVEVQTELPNPPYRILPIETDPDIRTAFKLAGDQGITVVAAAGNGGGDLGPFRDAEGGAIWDMNSADYDDSGAILVGAGRSQQPGVVPRSRIPESNYGERVDCQGWGDSVATTRESCGNPHPGANVPCNKGPNRRYDYFNGTSSATAMVGGVAACLQGAYRARATADGTTPTHLDPFALRAMLRNPAMGSPQPEFDSITGGAVAGTEAATTRIGPLPNLCALLRAVGIYPDVYMRDHLLDTGVVPSPLHRFRSPDIIVRNGIVSSAAGPQGEFGPAHWNEEFLGEDPILGQDNFIYVRMANRGNAPDDVEVTVYWTEAGMFLHPGTWNRIGSLHVSNIAKGESRVAKYPILWMASDLPPVGDYCLIAAVRSPRDPLVLPDSFSTTLRYLAFVRDHNNICFRNIKVVRSRSGADLSRYALRIRGIPDRWEVCRFEIHGDLPRGSRVRVESRDELLQQRRQGDLVGRPLDRPGPEKPLVWVSGDPVVLDGIILSPGADAEVQMAVELPPGTPPGQYEVCVDQYMDSHHLGRVTYLIHVRS